MNQFRAGAVWQGVIDFGDGEGERTKYLVLLGDCDNGEQVLVAVTTSKGGLRYGDAGSPSPCLPSGRAFRIPGKQENCFPVDTWVQFDNAYPISRTSLERLTQEGRASFLQSLGDERLRSLLACAKKSQDIPKRNLEQIDKALKARAPTKQPAPSRPSTPSAPPPFLSMEMISTRMRVDRLCGDCHAIFIDLVEVNATDLTTILQGKTKPPDNFLKKAQDGFELLDSENCGNCTK